MLKTFLKIHKLIIFSLFTISITFTSCDSLETDLYVNPSALNDENAQIDYLFNQMQLSYNGLYNSFNYSSSQVTRMELMRVSSYRANFLASSFDDSWSTAYQGVLINNKAMLEKIQILEAEGKDYSKYRAVSKILEAGTLVMLVDYFNNVPFSEALQIAAFPNPKRDNGSDIYEAAYQKLDEALAIINTVSSTALPINTDLYYGANGDMAKWRKLANSLKIQLLVNSRFQMINSNSRFNQLITDNNFINNNVDDFQFLYGPGFGVSDNRHPIFISQYQGEASIYLSSNYINMMIGDPREHYYFYRQTPGGDAFARPHGNTLPNVGTDYNQMTVHGIYPYGGRFNDGINFLITDNTMGLKGAGINPILTNFSTNFLIAEGHLRNGNISAARASMEIAIRANLMKIMNFNASSVEPSPISGPNVMTNTSINTYVSNTLTQFDSATDKLEVLMREFYKASFGNGIQVYNNYRRTGKPNNLAVLNTPSTFVYRMLYPNVYINNNLSPENQTFVDIDQRIWWADPSINLNF